MFYFVELVIFYTGAAFAAVVANNLNMLHLQVHLITSIKIYSYVF